MSKSGNAAFGGGGTFGNLWATLGEPELGEKKQLPTIPTRGVLRPWGMEVISSPRSRTRGTAMVVLVPTTELAPPGCTRLASNCPTAERRVGSSLATPPVHHCNADRATAPV